MEDLRENSHGLLVEKGRKYGEGENIEGGCNGQWR